MRTIFMMTDAPTAENPTGAPARAFCIVCQSRDNIEFVDPAESRTSPTSRFAQGLDRRCTKCGGTSYDDDEDAVYGKAGVRKVAPFTPKYSPTVTEGLSHRAKFETRMEAALAASQPAESVTNAGCCQAKSIEPAPVTLADAMKDVLAERQRQISAEGWSPEHDDTHINGEMAQAAACYALNAAGWKTEALRGCWPMSWASAWFKPTDQRRDLVKAGALIIAEIERLDRAALRTIKETAK